VTVVRHEIQTVFRSAWSLYQLIGNRRKFDRVPLNGPVVLRFSNSVVDRTEYCSCVDISPRGIGLSSPASIDPGCIVELDAQGRTRFARVRYCRPDDANYRIGLELLPDYDARR
jgi:hypothetical protein